MSENLYGLVAEYGEPEKLVKAAKMAIDAGFSEIETSSPHPIEELDDMLAPSWNGVGFWSLLGGLTGCIGGFFMQWYATVKDFPINIGGRPLNSWPAYIPITFELTVLFTGFAALISMLVYNRLPEPYQPLFNASNYDMSTGDKFFLCLKAADKHFKTDSVRRFLLETGAHSVEAAEL